MFCLALPEQSTTGWVPSKEKLLLTVLEVGESKIEVLHAIKAFLLHPNQEEDIVWRGEGVHVLRSLF